MLYGIRLGYVEVKSYGSVEAKLCKKLINGYILEAYIYIYIFMNNFIKHVTKKYMI